MSTPKDKIVEIQSPVEYRIAGLPDDRPRETEAEYYERMRIEGKTTTLVKLFPDLMPDA